MEPKDLNIENGKIFYGGQYVASCNQCSVRDNIVYDGDKPIFDANKYGGIKNFNMTNGSQMIGNIKAKGNISITSTSSTASDESGNHL